MKKTTYKNTQNGLLLFTILVVVSAFYLENVFDLRPCPLCIMQRFCILLLGFFCFVALGLKSLKRARFIAIIQSIFSILGLYFASRQIWLQSLPVDESQMCMPGLEALVHYFSPAVIIKAFFWGSSECSEVSWRFIGLSMPEWAAIYFSIMTAINSFLVVVLSFSLDTKDK
ncbi:MAG: disulfide bond formation protein B [Legionellaceae bacterium]|nr:disulfide bond formation protein B [Legionellaceae bacterium]